MSEDIEVTPQQLIIIRRLCNNEKLDAANDEKLSQNIEQLVQKGLIEKNNENEAVFAAEGGKLLTEWGIYPEKNESRDEEAVKLFSRIVALQKVLTDIERLATRPNLTAEEKFQQALGLIRHSRIESTY
jgi:hypothetical protein